MWPNASYRWKTSSGTYNDNYWFALSSSRICSDKSFSTTSSILSEPDPLLWKRLHSSSPEVFFSSFPFSIFQISKINHQNFDNTMTPPHYSYFTFFSNCFWHVWNKEGGCLRFGPIYGLWSSVLQLAIFLSNTLHFNSLSLFPNTLGSSSQFLYGTGVSEIYWE